MRATAIDVTDCRAVVELRPCWLARLFGARTVRLEIVRVNSNGFWRTVYSDDMVTHLEHGALILRALDFRPVGTLPAARLLP
jgi:hypothetical protein